MSVLVPATIVVGLGVGSYYAGPHIFPFALIPFAESDLFNTYISPGDGKMILRGNEFHDFHISMPGFHLNRPGSTHFVDGIAPWEILPNEKGKTDDYYDERPLWMKKFGFYPVGIPFQRKVNEEMFEWKEESEGKIIHRREMTRIFKTNKFPYVIVQTEVISKDGLRMKLTYIVGLRIVNPYKALILTEDWLVQVEAAIQQAVRNWASGFNFMQLISQTDETGDAAQKEDFEKMVKAIGPEMHDRFAVAIASADLKAPMPDGPEAEAHLKSIAAPFKAKQAAEVTVIEADANAAATEAAGRAEATVTEVKGRAAAKVTEVTGLATAKANEAVGMAGARVAKASAKAAVAGEIARYEAAEKFPAGAGTVVGGEALKGATVYAAPAWAGELAEKVAKKL